jgi:hypothetical protein
VSTAETACVAASVTEYAHAIEYKNIRGYAASAQLSTNGSSRPAHKRMSWTKLAPLPFLFFSVVLGLTDARPHVLISDGATYSTVLLPLSAAFKKTHTHILKCLLTRYLSLKALEINYSTREQMRKTKHKQNNLLLYKPLHTSFIGLLLMLLSST